MTVEVKTVPHESWHTACWGCRPGYGYEVSHDACKGACGHGLRCDGPCSCECSKPLTKDEVMRLRRFLESMR